MKKLFLKRLSQRGASLVEVLIAAAMMGGLSLVMANISENSNRATMSAEMKFNAIYALDKIHRDLSDMNTCSTTFEGVTLLQLKNHNFSLGSFSRGVSNNFPVKKTLPVSDLAACDLKDSSNVYRIPPLNEQDNCRNILSRDFARKQVYYEHCNYHDDKDSCKSNANDFFSSIIPADNIKTLYSQNDIVMDTKLQKVEILGFEEDTAVPPKFVNLQVRVTVDIRGTKENANVIGASTKSKTFSFKAFLTDTGGPRTIYSCQGEMSEEAAVEKACLAMDGHYSAGKCYVSGLVKNCRNVFAQITRATDTLPVIASGAEYNSSGYSNAIPIREVQVSLLNKVNQINDTLMNTFPYKVNAQGRATPSLDIDQHGQDLRYFVASAAVCKTGERVMSAYGVCGLNIPINKKSPTVGIGQMLQAQISRPGNVLKEAKQNHWTVGCAVPFSVYDSSPQFNAQISALCCENIIYED